MGDTVRYPKNMVLSMASMTMNHQMEWGTLFFEKK